MSQSETELRALWAREPGATLKQAIAEGPEAYSDIAWRVITEEAARRQLAPRVDERPGDRPTPQNSAVAEGTIQSPPPQPSTHTVRATGQTPAPGGELPSDTTIALGVFAVVLLLSLAGGQLSLAGIIVASVLAFVATRIAEYLRDNGGVEAVLSRLFPPSSSVSQAGSMEPEAKEEWFYSGSGDAPLGPVSRTEMEDMLSRGVLLGDVLVWTESLQDWTPANRVEALRWKRPSVPPPLPPRPPTGDSSRLPPQPPTPPQYAPPPPQLWAPPPYPYPSPHVPDEIAVRHSGTLRHVDASARGRLINVVGRILTSLCMLVLLYGAYVFFVQGRSGGAQSVIVLGLIGLGVGIVLRIFGSTYEHIYRRDKR